MLHSYSLRETLEVWDHSCHIREKSALGSARQPSILGLHLEGRPLCYSLSLPLTLPAYRDITSNHWQLFPCPMKLSCGFQDPVSGSFL